MVMARTLIQSYMAIFFASRQGRSSLKPIRTSQTASMNDCLQGASLKLSTTPVQILVEWMTFLRARETRTAWLSLSWNRDSSTFFEKARNKSDSIIWLLEGKMREPASRESYRYLPIPFQEDSRSDLGGC